MAENLVRDLLIQEVTSFGARGQLIKRVSYSYFVGTHGPFTDLFDNGTDSPEAVMQARNNRIAQLRAIGAISREE